MASSVWGRQFHGKDTWNSDGTRRRTTTTTMNTITVTNIMSLLPSFLLQWWRSIIDFLQGLMESGLTVSFTKTQISVKTIGKKNQSIGEGAFSIVYQAADQKQPNRRYALKRMLLQSLDLANMARNEVEAYRKFTHPHIIQLIDYAERVEDNKAVMYLLFPYYQRGSMRDELNLILSGAKRKSSLKGVVLKWFHSLCEAVQVLHDYTPSHVHFDIKPEVSKCPVFSPYSSLSHSDSCLCRMCW